MVSAAICKWLLFKVSLIEAAKIISRNSSYLLEVIEKETNHLINMNFACLAYSRDTIK